MNTDIRVFYGGKVPFIINPTILDRQKAWENLDKIKEAHQLNLIIFEMMKKTDNASELRSLAEDVQLVQFELQRLWNFPQDARFHRPWLLPKCSCPRMDNEERWGTGEMVTNANCLLHGDDI